MVKFEQDRFHQITGLKANNKFQEQNIMALPYSVRGGHNNATFHSAKRHDSWPNYVDRF